MSCFGGPPRLEKKKRLNSFASTWLSMIPRPVRGQYSLHASRSRSRQSHLGIKILFAPHRCSDNYTTGASFFCAYCETLVATTDKPNSFLSPLQRQIYSGLKPWMIARDFLYSTHGQSGYLARRYYTNLCGQPAMILL